MLVNHATGGLRLILRPIFGPASPLPVHGFTLAATCVNTGENLRLQPLSFRVMVVSVVDRYHQDTWYAQRLNRTISLRTTKTHPTVSVYGPPIL